MANISVVINTLNEAKNLPRAVASVKGLCDELIVCDMWSIDGTREVAKKLGAKVIEHDRTGYIEPARNYAISKANGKWILILDADEEIPKTLKEKLNEIAEKSEADYYRVPRKNIIFGKWLKHSRYWPDLNIRFFKKGHVSWSEIIHSVPVTQGNGVDLPDEESLAIIHNHYDSVDTFLERMNRYTTIQANDLSKKENYKFIWKDVIEKPVKEFLSRYFAGEGYKDGLHGLAISLLQAFSEVVVYLKVWQSEKFLEQAITLPEIEKEVNDTFKDTKWWIYESKLKTENFLTAIVLKILRKFYNSNADKSSKMS